MSIAICLLMITSISAPFTQNIGQPQIVGQSQNLVQSGPSPTSGGTGGLADSPWPMYRGNVRHTGLSKYDTSGNIGELMWSFATGDEVHSSPAIGPDGTIYICSEDRKLYAINPDGTQKWNYITSRRVTTSPAIGSDGVVYFGSQDSNLYAINPDGSKKWNFFTGQEIYSSPAIGPDGTIYIGSGSRLYAMNPTGTKKWDFHAGGTIESSPAIGSDGSIYVGSDDFKLYAVNPNGTKKWSYTTGRQVRSSPAIGSDGTIYVGSIDHKLHAINPDGSKKWSFTMGSFVHSSPAIGPDGTIYIGSDDDKLYAIHSNGIEKWNFNCYGSVYSSPSIGYDGTIYVGSAGRELFAIYPNGAEKWRFRVDGNIFYSSPAIGSDGTIYIGSAGTKLYAIGTPSLKIDVTSHFSELNSAAQSAIKVHVTDGTNPIQGATVNLVSDNGGIFSPQSGITNAIGNFKSIFNAPTVTTQIICRISAEASKTGYNNGTGYVDVTINPIPWPMFRQNLNNTGQSPYDTSSNPGKLKWSFTTGDEILSSPAIDSDGTIYIGSNDYKLYAINSDGTEKWTFTTGDVIYNLSPAIGSDGTIYVGSYDNNLYAINPDGLKKWHFTTKASLRYSSPAIGSDGTIYIGSSDNNLYAINPDGTEKWHFTKGSLVESSPAIGSDGTIYVGSDKKLYAINPDGTKKWSFMTGRYILEQSPTIGADGIIYFGSTDDKLYAINPDGTEKWNFKANATMNSPAIGTDKTIYVGSNDNNLYAINPDGSEKWRFTGATDSIQSTPAIGSDGTIFVGSEDNKLYAIDQDGSEKWSYTTGGSIYSSPAMGSDGTIYVGSKDGKLYAIGIPTQIQLPVADAGPDQTVNEGDYVELDASASYDPDGTIESYEWDFDASDGLWWETGVIPDATGPTPTHTYGDDGVYIVTLRVTDNDNLSATDTCNVTVHNVNPTVTIESITMDVEIGLRVAGRKYNNVSMTLYEDGSSIGYVSIERIPGSPDEQIAWIPVSINFLKFYNATVTYSPENPPNVGGNPVWIYLKPQNGSIKKIHHTFNVQQSKKRDSDHWNHVEPWEVDLSGHFIGLPFEISSHITDPGSDDETLTYTYGSQVKAITFLNNPPNPDPYPSPEINPVDIIDTTTLVYEGPGTVTLVVKDDDNIRLGIGLGSDSIDVE